MHKGTGRGSVAGRRRMGYFAGMGEAEAGRGSEIRLAALSMLIRVAGDTDAPPVSLREVDEVVGRLLTAGYSERDIRNALGISHDDLVAALWRLSRYPFAAAATG